MMASKGLAGDFLPYPSRFENPQAAGSAKILPRRVDAQRQRVSGGAAEKARFIPGPSGGDDAWGDA